MPKCFPIGIGANVRDYVPLSEAAIQRYMRHPSIVETYWADVRCLDPATSDPLSLGVQELARFDAAGANMRSPVSGFQPAGKHVLRVHCPKISARTCAAHMRTAVPSVSWLVHRYLQPTCVFLVADRAMHVRPSSRCIYTRRRKVAARAGGPQMPPQGQELETMNLKGSRAGANRAQATLRKQKTKKGAGGRLTEVKLQLRIAMEPCDLGARAHVFDIGRPRALRLHDFAPGLHPSFVA